MGPRSHHFDLIDDLGARLPSLRLSDLLQIVRRHPASQNEMFARHFDLNRSQSQVLRLMQKASDEGGETAVIGRRGALGGLRHQHASASFPEIRLVRGRDCNSRADDWAGCHDFFAFDRDNAKSSVAFPGPISCTALLEAAFAGMGFGITNFVSASFPGVETCTR